MQTPRVTRGDFIQPIPGNSFRLMMNEASSVKLDEAALLEFSLRPFRVFESMGLAAQYERSFKFEPGEMISQRYMLAVPVDPVRREQLVAAAQALDMPTHLCDEFAQALDGARMSEFGFEGSARSAVFKVYAEYPEPPRRALIGTEPTLLFRGFKWRADRPHSGVQTLYHGRPGLSNSQIRERIDEHLDGPYLSFLRESVVAMLDRATGARAHFVPRWLELGEAGQPVRAFDLNLYEAGLRVGAIGAELSRLADQFSIPATLTARLLDVTSAGLLGHLSAGRSRDGSAFLTIYFEP